MPHHPAHSNPPPQRPDPGAAAAAPLPLASGQTLLFFGDSITAADPGYVTVLDQAVRHARPELDVRLINAGISGNTVRDLEARFERDVLAHHPTWVAICIGTNDYLGAAAGQPQGVPLAEFEARYDALLGRLEAARIGVVLMTIPVIGSDAPESPLPDPARYNEAIAALAVRHGLRLVDIHRAFRDVYERALHYKQQVLLTTDGIHPNPQGNALIARTLVTHLGLLNR
ncbi:MAG TPA: SGNH/GDSL hydrolase family protein [Chloroflexia bacterium]|nr:SGNH/GDSL hydrolase family protein [Chloroflexia bacterium]